MKLVPPSHIASAATTARQNRTLPMTQNSCKLWFHVRLRHLSLGKVASTSEIPMCYRRYCKKRQHERPCFHFGSIILNAPPLTIQAQSTACQATVAAAMLLSMSVHVRALLKDSAKAMVQKFSSKQPKLHIFSIPQWLHSYRHCYTAAFQIQAKIKAAHWTKDGKEMSPTSPTVNVLLVLLWSVEKSQNHAQRTLTTKMLRSDSVTNIPYHGETMGKKGRCFVLTLAK